MIDNLTIILQNSIGKQAQGTAFLHDVVIIAKIVKCPVLATQVALTQAPFSNVEMFS